MIYEKDCRLSAVLYLWFGFIGEPDAVLWILCQYRDRLSENTVFSVPFFNSILRSFSSCGFTVFIEYAIIIYSYLKDKQK